MLCPTCSTPNPEGSAACRVCGAPLGAPADAGNPHALPPGTSLRAGAYRLERVLGEGGFGITYAGKDVALARGVAIKEFFPAGSGRSGLAVRPAGGISPEEYRQARERFLEEARLLARFHHSGIVQVHTSFEENDTAYMVMELLRGKTLMRRLEEGGPLPEAEALSIVERVGEALAAVHAAGLLHRDIKPDNVMLTEEGRAVLIDFGTAREFAAGSTRRMTAMLTPGYAPLEQYSQQARFGTFTDVYALAATLYHVLTGQLPAAALDRVQGVELVPPHRLRPELSRSVSDALVWALELQVKSRPQSVPEFLAALRSRAGAAPARPTADAAKADLAPRVEALIDRYEREPQVAEQELYSGALERRLSTLPWGKALAPRARELTLAHPREREKGTELFLRELYRAAGEEPYPRLEAEPPQLDLGEHVAGARAAAAVRLRNRGRGHAWGTVSVQPPVPGLSVPGHFHSATARVEVQLDTLGVRPGEYSGTLVLSPEGVPAPVSVPLRYRVAPLEAAVEPKRLDLGTLSPGERATSAIRVTTTPAGGRLAGTAALAPPLEGLTVTPTFGGPAAELQVTADGRALTPGTHYRGEVRLETSAGTFTVPLRVRVAMAWRPVVIEALRGAAVAAAGGALGRYWLGAAAGTDKWLLRIPDDPRTHLVASGIAVAVLLGMAVATGQVRRAVGAPLASWSGVKWLLASLLLGCAGIATLVSGVGLGLVVTADRFGWIIATSLPPPAGWAVLGGLLGLLYGTAPALIRAGRPRTGTALHWAAVLATFLLAAWGWLTAPVTR